MRYLAPSVSLFTVGSTAILNLNGILGSWERRQQLPRCHTPGPLPLEFLDFAQIPHHCRRQLGDSFMSSERRPFGCSGLEGPSWREESVFVSRQLLQRLPAHCCTHCCVSCLGPAVRLCRSLFNMVQGLPEPCREPCQVWVRGCRILRGGGSRGGACSFKIDWVLILLLFFCFLWDAFVLASVLLA